MINVVEFDFTTKKDRVISFEDLKLDCRVGEYYWINLGKDRIEEFLQVFEKLCPGTPIDKDFLSNTSIEVLNLFQNSIHFTIFEPYFIESKLVSKPIQVILGKSFLATIVDGNSKVINNLHITYHNDFVEFSQSPGFLLFEIVDYASSMYQNTFRVFAEEIDRLQIKLFESVNDEIFMRVANLTQQLLDFRSMLVSAREIISVLATRKSPFISETTQPFLERKSTLLARLSDDLSTERAVISDIFNLYMGFVSYKTNNLINRLTIISLIFLPITFLVGIYGTNFSYIPELQWKYSYFVFWILMIVIVALLLWFFKRRKWI